MSTSDYSNTPLKVKLSGKVNKEKKRGGHPHQNKFVGCFHILKMGFCFESFSFGSIVHLAVVCCLAI